MKDRGSGDAPAFPCRHPDLGNPWAVPEGEDLLKCSYFLALRRDTALLFAERYATSGPVNSRTAAYPFIGREIHKPYGLRRCRSERLSLMTILVVRVNVAAIVWALVYLVASLLT